MARSSKKRTKRQQASDDRSSESPNWVEKTNLLLGAAVLAITIIGAGIHFSGTAGKGPSDLTLVGMTVRDIHRGSGSHGRLEIALHNTGDRLVVIDQARFEIRRIYRLPRCTTQGDLPLTNVYGIVLPIGAKPGDVVKAPLHQQVAADEADRFAISLSTKRPADGPAAVYLFEFDLALVNDGPQSPLVLGTVLASLPEMAASGEYFWTKKTVALLRNYENPEHLSPRERWGEAMPCWRSNTVVLGRALANPAVRAPELNALSDNLVTPSYSALE
jgi:hypothetical protein